jgi:YD repeat-containing protein
MFRRFLTFLVLLALSNTFINRLTHASVLTSSAVTLKSTKEKKKTCAPCAAGMEATGALEQLDKLATLGRRTQVQPLLSSPRSVFEGATVNFVSTATGQLAFAVTDLELAGTMPLLFQRIYSSDRGEDRGLGTGWSFILDDRITVDNHSATMKTGGGTVIYFRREEGSRRFRLQVDAPFPHQSFELVNEGTITEQSAGLTRTYTRLNDAYRLSRVSDTSGNYIAISFDAGDQIARIENSSGATLTLEWSNGADSQLLSVSDNTGRRTTYRQDAKRLRTVMDPAGSSWTYDYEGARLVRAADPLGRSLLRARYDRAGRVVEAGDAAGAYLYDYDAATTSMSRLTSVTDPAGAKTTLSHSTSGLVTAVTESGGRTLRFKYNAANRPVSMADSLGDEMNLSYDAQHRLLRQWSADGTDKSYGYDESGRLNSVTEGGVRTDYTLDDGGQILAARGSDPTRNYRASYNGRGQMISLKSEKREVSFEYDERGHRTASVYSDAGRFSLERDAAGRVAMERFPSGLSIYNTYDARGVLAKQSDSRGRSMRVERDQSGAPVAYVRADGKSLSLVRDATSRVIAMTDFNGSTRRFAYDARGALTDYTDTKGSRFKYEYDGQGRLLSITKANGTRLNVERDERGRVRRVVAVASAGKANNLRGQRLSHAPAAQVDMDDPTIDWGDPLVIDVWARFWGIYPINGGLVGSDGSMFLTEQSAGNEGSTGGTSLTQEQSFECAMAAGVCIIAIYGYIQAMGGLGVVCAETVGLGCLAALMLHPILSSVMVMKCADAINKCNLNR